MNVITDLLGQMKVSVFYNYYYLKRKKKLLLALHAIKRAEEIQQGMPCYAFLSSSKWLSYCLSISNLHFAECLCIKIQTTICRMSKFDCLKLALSFVRLSQIFSPLSIIQTC